VITHKPQKASQPNGIYINVAVTTIHTVLAVRIGKLTLTPSDLTHVIILGGIFVIFLAQEHPDTLTKQIISGAVCQVNSVHSGAAQLIQVKALAQAAQCSVVVT
jgi:hypothetical protein